MSEHLIQLRGGWEIIGPSNHPLIGRLTLPSAELSRIPGPVQLRRRFQKPPLDLDHETLWLRLDSVPGLSSVVFNDQSIARGPFSTWPLLFPLGRDLSRRNQLLLEVESSPRPDDAPWGQIALIIREAEGV